MTNRFHLKPIKNPPVTLYFRLKQKNWVFHINKILLLLLLEALVDLLYRTICYPRLNLKEYHRQFQYNPSIVQIQHNNWRNQKTSYLRSSWKKSHFLQHNHKPKQNLYLNWWKPKTIHASNLTSRSWVKVCLLNWSKSRCKIMV